MLHLYFCSVKLIATYWLRTHIIYWITCHLGTYFPTALISFLKHFDFYLLTTITIQSVHEGTQVYIDYIQWTIELGGTISHYTKTLIRDIHTLIILTVFLLVEYLIVLKYSSISFCRVRKCVFLFVN